MGPLRAHYDAIVVGAGVAGLTACALLADDGVRTLAVERHNVPGGCASFFQFAGFRFDVGATLVGGFGTRGIHRRLFERLHVAMDAVAVEPAMIVHMPGARVMRYGDARWASERVRAFGLAAEPFWRAQERIADAAWDLAARAPALPVDVMGVAALASALRPRHAALVAARGRSVASILPPNASSRLRAFVDAQLLITSQSDAAATDLAYGATALDLAREGTYHLADGIGAIATALGRAARRRGADIAYGRQVARLDVVRGRVRAAVLADGTRIGCDRVVAALPLQNLVALCPELGPAFRARVASVPQRWGAFVLYVGLPPGVAPDDLALHHQLIRDQARPLGEGNSAFLSFSGPSDARRARGGGRAVTISTHTDVARWERAAADGRYEALRDEYARRMSEALDCVLPGAAARAVVRLPATPATFIRYTARARGLVGGVPQTTALAGLAAFGHRTPLANLFVCGDATFPGQSTVGATLSGINAARAAAR